MSLLQDIGKEVLEFKREGRRVRLVVLTESEAKPLEDILCRRDRVRLTLLGYRLAIVKSWPFKHHILDAAEMQDFFDRSARWAHSPDGRMSNA